MFPHADAPAEPLFRFEAGAPRRAARAGADLLSGVMGWRLAWALAWADIRNRYRGSALGPFWLTLSTAVTLASLGLLYSALLHESLRSYLPFLAVSMIVWNMISQIVSDSANSLIQAEGLIRQLPMPYTVHALRGLFRNVIVAAHNLPLIVIVFAFAHVPLHPEAVTALFGLALVALDAFAAALLLGMLCARFRDLGQIVNNVMQLAFFVTPILWKPAALGPRARWLLLDPFYGVLQAVRAPLLSQPIGAALWMVTLGYSALLCAISLAFFVRYRARIAFWV